MGKSNSDYINLTNELRNYLVIKRRLDEESSSFDNQIAWCERKIEEYDTLLSAGNAKGVQYGYVPTTAVYEPTLKLLSEQEEYIQRRKELLELKKKDLDGYRARVTYIENCLSCLEEPWQKEFLLDVYSKNVRIEVLENKHGYTDRQLYRYKKSLVYDMLDKMKQL